MLNVGRYAGIELNALKGYRVRDFFMILLNYEEYLNDMKKR